MTGRIKHSFRNGKESISGAQAAVVNKARKAARRTDYYVHDNAWTMMAVTAGLAFAAGFLISRAGQEIIALESADGAMDSKDEKEQKVSTFDFVHSAIPLLLFTVRALQRPRRRMAS
jgi:hypothetical protein